MSALVLMSPDAAISYAFTIKLTPYIDVTGGALRSVDRKRQHSPARPRFVERLCALSRAVKSHNAVGVSKLLNLHTKTVV